MELMIMAVFALSVGHLLGAASALRRTWTPMVATAVVLAVAVCHAIDDYPRQSWTAPVLVSGVLLGSALTEAAMLRGHPLFLGESFATRVKAVLTRGRWIRAGESEHVRSDPRRQHER